MFPSPALNVPTVTWLLRALMRGKKIKQKQPCPPKALFKYGKKLINTYVYFIRMEKNPYGLCLCMYIANTIRKL